LKVYVADLGYKVAEMPIMKEISNISPLQALELAKQKSHQGFKKLNQSLDL
jgi:hypothetical protein